MQICVKTWEGTITLDDAKPDDTIELVRKKIKIKLESMFTVKDEMGAPVASAGDIDRYLDFFEVLPMLFQGTTLENSRTLAHYGIEKNDTLVVNGFLSGEGTYVSFCFISFHFK